jgi:hypothetical protein
LTRALMQINGWALLVDANTVNVNGTHYKASNILLAVGGKPTVPKFPGAELTINSDGFFGLQQQPKKVRLVQNTITLTLVIFLFGIYLSIGRILIMGNFKFISFHSEIHDASSHLTTHA